MKDNVLIKIFERGKLIGTRSGHNIWLDHGRAYLASMIGYATLGPDVPEVNDRIRYMELGIGGNKQALLPMANSPPLSVSYQVGADPNATSGNEYNTAYPIYPPITTLERPVRITGGVAPYPGVPSDNWLIDTPNLFFTHTALSELTVHAIVDGSAGHIVYSSFLQMPLCEAGLVLDEVGAGMHIPYSPVAAYYTFDTILLTPTVKLEFIWTVRF